MFDFKKDNRFEDLGSLKEFGEKFGICKISIASISEANIHLSIKSNQEIEFKMLCSIPLSQIIRAKKSLPENIAEYRVLRIKENDETSYIRVSQSIIIEADSDISFNENIEKIKDIDGSVLLSVKVKDFKPDPLIDFDDLIKL